MAQFEKAIEQAIADQDIPGCVLHAINRDGSLKYDKAFGKRSVRVGGDQSPLQPNTVMWIASCTKLMTAVCVMQLVEQGRLSLDAPVYDVIPELKDFPILEEMKEDGTPILTPHKNPITLRLLLSHSSGITYGAMHPPTLAYYEATGKDPGLAGTVLERFGNPMTFEPGTSWAYGPGIDYAGLMVERVSKMTLEDYMKKNLWGPLGVKDMTFSLSRRPDLKDRKGEICKRDEDTGKIAQTDDRMPHQTEDGGDVKDCMGGQGVFAPPEEYIKILHAVLTTDENEKILKKSSVEQLTKPQLSEAASAQLNAALKLEQMNNAMGATSLEVKRDYGLGGLVICEDDPAGPREGTMVWGGYPNLLWFIDRKSGLAGLYASQILPPGDAKTAILDKKFEAGMYEKLKRGNASQI
ncbi:beta-lactamase family protein [Polyplosphaeria fusca]|uniref:Beta-lactamase family protein n=1 Tax=Polyplosphaeria fusca TaxID=682080 RepID=A0A9P4R7W8_9PLEO|nr:beta-lactamase family protein [Polyplosphaeria fusca]